MTVAAAKQKLVVKQPPTDTLSTSIASNPQQGMSDPGVITGSNKGPTPPVAPCSPLTISSALEQQNADNNSAAVADVPVAVVGGPFMQAPPPNVPEAAAPVPSAEERRWKRTPPTESDPRKLFVGGLPTHVNDEQFLRFFEQFGEVIDSVVMVDRNTKRSRGFGFVTFANQDVTSSLLNNIPGKTGLLNILGKSCEIKASEPKVDDGSRRYNYNGSNNSGGKKTGVQQFNNQHQHVAIQNQYNRGNGYNGDERDFDDINYRFEPASTHQGYYNQGHNSHYQTMMYHHPYGYAHYQNYPNYFAHEGPGSNFEGGGSGAPYHNYYSNGFYPNQQQFAGQYQYGALPMNYGGVGESGQGTPPYAHAQQQHSNYGGYYSQVGQMNHGQINDGGSTGSTSYEAQVYPATTDGVDGDYNQAAAGES